MAKVTGKCELYLLKLKAFSVLYYKAVLTVSQSERGGGTQVKGGKLIGFLPLSVWEPLSSLAAAHTEVLTPYPPLHLNGNSFLPSQMLSLAVLRQAGPEEWWGWPSSPVALLRGGKKEEVGEGWGGGVWALSDSLSVWSHASTLSPNALRSLRAKINITSLHVSHTGCTEPREGDGEGVGLYFLQEQSNHKTWHWEKRRPRGRGRERGNRVWVSVFLAGAVKCSALLLPDILRYHGYRFTGHGPALSAPSTPSGCVGAGFLL